MNGKIATLAGLTPEAQAITDTLALPETTLPEITAKLTALQALAANYPGGTPAEQAA